MWMTHADMWWWWPFMGLFWVVLWSTVLYLIFMAIRGASAERQKADPASIARRRYATGEIDRNEFEQITRDLAKFAL